MNEIRLHPNAKINIGLYVTEKRTDGFHNLETIFYPVNLCDELIITKIQDKYGECQFTQKGVILDCPDEDNLVVKAYRLLCADYNLPSVKVCLTKNIPFGAGLGGGSADAAFMLKGVETLFDLQIGNDRLEQYASRLGSDCAFFVKNKPVFAEGRGEIFRDINISLRGLYIVLVKPAHGVSTADAFGGIKPKAASIDLKLIANLPILEWREVVENAFEHTVFIKYPDLAEIKQSLYNKGAIYVSMSGSGSTVFGLFKEKPVDISDEFENRFVWQGELA